MNLIRLAILFVLVLCVWYILGISAKQRNRMVRMYVKFVKKENEIIVRIINIGKLPVEIQAPEIKFYNRSNSRAFAIKSPNRNIFPLILSPLTDYEFRVDLDRFYDHDNSLHEYKKVKLNVREKTGKLLKTKMVWI